MRILGIDPGLSGALGLLGDGFKYLECADIPLMQRGKTTGKQMINDAELAKIIATWRPELIVVELVNAAPRIPGQKPCPSCKQARGMGAASAFNFGDSAGVIRGIVGTIAVLAETLGAPRIERHFVTPQSWKTRAGLVGNRDKEASRAKAIQMWPLAPLSRKKDQGRAEALLIARFGLVGDFFTTVTKPDVPRVDESPKEQQPFQIF
jgi:crossover junction endodeoxyribonuclease RuvC